nr:putative amidotransferase [uncultured organism]
MTTAVESPSTGRPRIGILLFDQVKMLDFAGPAEVFFEAGQRSAGYEIVMLSVDGKDVVTSMGVRVGVHASVEEAGEIDTFIVPGTESALTVFSDHRLLEAVRRLAGRARRVAGVCTGAFALAATGLLDGRAATTHWKFTSQIAARFPRVELHPEAIFIRDGDVYTSAGVAAGIDLALALLEEDHGAEVARAVAQLLLVHMKRSGNQSQFSALLSGPVARTPLVKLVTEHVAEDPSRPYTASGLAARANVSVRHLNRMMRDEVGMSPIEYVGSLRLDLAVSYLDSGATVAEAAASAGYSTPVALRRAFVARFTITPSEYQRRFQSTRREGGPGAATPVLAARR